MFHRSTAQLRDVAYGTKSHVFRPDVTGEDTATADEFDETVDLARGENLLEIHLGKAHLSPEALASLQDPEPSTFCTYAFYDYQIQSTAVVRGARPAYDSTSRYVVRMDDHLLQYLHNSSLEVEAQLAQGLDYRTLATGHLRLSQLLDRHGKVFGTLHLVGELHVCVYVCVGVCEVSHLSKSSYISLNIFVAIWTCFFVTSLAPHTSWVTYLKLSLHYITIH